MLELVGVFCSTWLKLWGVIWGRGRFDGECNGEMVGDMILLGILGHERVTLGSRARPDGATSSLA